MVLQKFFGVLFIVSILTGIHGTDSIPKQVVDIAKIAVTDPIELKKGVPQWYMPSEPHGEGGISRRALEKIRARRKMMPSGV